MTVDEMIAQGGAECKVCGKRMLIADGCDCTTIECNGVLYERIKYGDEEYEWTDERCHDCGALPGHYHHANCDVEECPVCGGQFIGCDCDIEFCD